MFSPTIYRRITRNHAVPIGPHLKVGIFSGPNGKLSCKAIRCCYIPSMHFSIILQSTYYHSAYAEPTSKETNKYNYNKTPRIPRPVFIYRKLNHSGTYSRNKRKTRKRKRVHGEPTNKTQPFYTSLLPHLVSVNHYRHSFPFNSQLQMYGLIDLRISQLSCRRIRNQVVREPNVRFCVFLRVLQLSPSNHHRYRRFCHKVVGERAQEDTNES